MTEPLDPTLMSDTDAVETAIDGDESYCAACGQSYPLELDVCPKDGARLAKLKARPDALLGRVFENRFEIRSSVGSGGMGTVYRGWQISTDREVAIKVIHPKLANDRIAVKRFLREARLSSRLQQSNIVAVHDFGQTDDGILYLVMELLPGHTLARELEPMRPLPIKRVTRIALQLCDALDYAHKQGIIHRDLKPGNIVILDDPPGRDLVKVLDFGLAKSLVTDTSSVVTNTDAILGTPLYMPPEQIEGKPSDQRGDLYSLGCILHQMVTGRPPFVAESVNLVLQSHLNDRPPPLPPNIPAALAETIAKLMAKDPAKRLPSAAAAHAEIQDVVESGHAKVDVADTTPEVGRSLLQTSPIALAMTDPAAAAGKVAAPLESIAPARVAAPAAEPAPAAPLAKPPSRSRRLLAMAALGIAAAIATVVVIKAQRSSSPAADDTAPKIDAHMTVVVPADAAPAPPDTLAAAAPVDAPTIAPPPPPIDAPPKQPTRVRPKPDADPTIEFIPLKN